MEFQTFFFNIRKGIILGNDDIDINSIALHSTTVFIFVFQITHPGRYGPLDRGRYGPAHTSPYQWSYSTKHKLSCKQCSAWSMTYNDSLISQRCFTKLPEIRRISTRVQHIFSKTHSLQKLSFGKPSIKVHLEFPPFPLFKLTANLRPLYSNQISMFSHALASRVAIHICGHVVAPYNNTNW